MSRANDSAYPHAAGYDFKGERVMSQNGGLTIREHFAARAPAEPQFWFTPVMPTSQPIVPRWQEIADATVRKDVQDAFDAGVDPQTPEGAAWIEHNSEMRRASDAWLVEFRKQHLIQWPWAWADAVIAAGSK